MAELVLIFVTPIIENAVSEAVSLAAAQISMAWGLEKELGELARTLIKIQGLLQDAEGKQESNQAIRNWLQDLRDVAYDAVDVLDEYGYEVLKHKVQTQGRKRKQVRTFFGLFNRTAFCLSMADKIRKINKTLVKISNDGDLLMPVRLGDQSHSTACARPFPLTDSFLGDLKIVGRDNDVFEIVNKLDNIRSEHLLSGISIVGFGGIGKTTLARSIYRMVKEKKLYDLVAWVCVSHEFDEKIILGQMLEHFDSSAGQINNIDSLIQKLGQKLENRKFLLVLDDVWSDDRDKWDTFKSHLLKILKTSGNSILVTTRSGKVASIMEALPMQKHDMVKLSDYECWLIIEDTVLGSSTKTSIPLDLEGIGQEIAKKCGGLPLVACVIGGALSREMKTDKWQEILDDEARILQDEKKMILSVLKMSFDRLPSSLKRCFSYFSIFPKDAVILKDDLIQLWIAQGFAHRSNGSLVEMEDIANDYFNELLSNFLFQDVKWDLYGNIESCKMHDLMHDLALLISKDETWVWDTRCNFDVQNCSSIRHLRVESNGEDFSAIPRSVAQRLHSLFSNVDVFCSMASDLKRLRSLKLMGYKTRKLWTSLSKLKHLKHLKYLDISTVEVIAVPKSFSKLYNLQTLKLLNFVVDSKKGCQIEDLGCLSQLEGKLEISKLEYVRSKLKASMVNLKEKIKLHQLKLCWSSGYEGAVNINNNEEVLESLQSPSTLKSLTIEGYKGKMFPTWIVNDVSFGFSFLLNNIVKLQLINCDECTCIPSLGLLPSLKVLYIAGMENVRRMGHELQPGGAKSIRLFPALKTLTVCHMERLEEWVEVVEDAAVGSQGVIVFPCLEKLLISECPLLKTWSIGGLSTLETLILSYCDGCLPIGLDSCISLQWLGINNCPNLISIPEDIEKLHSLNILSIINCKNLRSIPGERLASLTCLKGLRLGPFWSELEEFPGLTSIHQLHASLEELELNGRNKLKSLPHQLQHLTALKKLRLSMFNGLKALPEWLGDLYSLHRLEIWNCSNLNYLL